MNLTKQDVHSIFEDNELMSSLLGNKDYYAEKIKNLKMELKILQGLLLELKKELYVKIEKEEK
jgi:hypothetical protein